MGLDLSWLWSWFQTVVDAIASWFQSIWDAVQQITNTGQGLFAGLVSLGSSIWQAIVDFGTNVYNAFKTIYDGIVWLANQFVEAFKTFGTWIWQTFSAIPGAIWSGLQWLYNGFVWLGQQIAKIFEGVWKFISNAFGAIYNAIVGWIETFRLGINEWFTNLFKVFRVKLKQTIIANVSLTMMWKTMEKAASEPSAKTIIGAIASPFIAVPVSYLIAEVVDALVPNPLTNPIELIPPIKAPSITLPEVKIETPPELAYPEKPPTPMIGYGLPYDVILPKPDETIGLSYDLTIASQDFEQPGVSQTLSSSHDETIESQDASLDPSTTLSLTYETEVA